MSLPSSFAPTVPHPSADASSGACISSLLEGAGTVPSHTVSVDVPGVSGASFEFTDPLHFWDGKDPFDKGAMESLPLGRAVHLQAFREVVCLITVQVFSQLPNLLSPALRTGRLGLATLGCLVSVILAFSSPFLSSCRWSERRLRINLSK